MLLRLMSSVFAAVVLVSAQVSSTPAKTSGGVDPSQQSRIEGRIVNSSTGEPVNKARLTLRAQGAQQTAVAVNGPPAIFSYVSSSDAQGNFVFEDVDAGVYTLSAERAGYVRQNYGAKSATASGTNLKVDAGQRIVGLAFKLTPQGIIRGKIVDEDGDPVTGVVVQVYRSSYLAGKQRLLPIGGSQMNADGTFMIGNLGPGRYYVSAGDNRPPGFAGPAERPGRRSPELAYATTFYPSASDAAAATPIEVTAGADIPGIEIRLRQVQVFHIRGRVVGTTSNTPAQNLMLVLQPTDASGPVLFGRQGMSAVRDPGGSFEFSRVAPGTYTIRTNGVSNSDKSAPLLVRYPVTVNNENLDDLVVPLAPGLEITGTLRIEGDDSRQTAQQANQQASLQANARQIAQPTVTLRSNAGSAASARIMEDGTFRLPGVAPEKYGISVLGLPDGTYVKSIKSGGQEISQTTIDLTSGAGGMLEILLSPNAVDAAGVVRNAGGATVAGVAVSLWSSVQNADSTLDQPRAANTDQNGAFRIRNLAPGEYRIAAWEDIEQGLAQNLEFRKRFEGQATVVKLGDGSQGNADVKLISKAAIDAEVEKIQ